MRRQIKFRAWDIESRHMVSWDMIVEEIETDGFPMFDHIFRQDHYVLMQFTGLLDKHGKEIYEGDILFWDGSVIGAVRFSHAEFVAGEGVDARALCAAPVDEVKIIGDIYQNPELLSAEVGGG